MEPIVRDFLANLPEDRGLTLSQVVAKAKPFIVDVRQPEEYSKGFIEGAVNIPLRELARSLQSLPAMDKDIAVVCDSGHRSAIGMAALQMLGYKKAKSIAGGLQSWQAAKLPLVTQPVPKRAAGPAPKVNADVQATLDHYLMKVLPEGWGAISPAALAEDQAKKSSLEMDIQPETYDQGPAVLVDVDEPNEFAKETLPKAINIPLRGLVDNLDKIPADKVTLWA
jgi:rhodanese-related sulfurtransferase